jgi:hypothetical protein
MVLSTFGDGHMALDSSELGVLGVGKQESCIASTLCFWIEGIVLWSGCLVLYTRRESLAAQWDS